MKYLRPRLRRQRPCSSWEDEDKDPFPACFHFRFVTEYFLICVHISITWRYIFLMLEVLYFCENFICLQIRLFCWFYCWFKYIFSLFLFNFIYFWPYGAPSISREVSISGSLTQSVPLIANILLTRQRPVHWILFFPLQNVSQTKKFK